MLSALTNGRLLDCVRDEPLENASVLFEDGEIKEIYSGEKPLPDGAATINVGVKTILPGLTDAHHHPAVSLVDVHKFFTQAPILTAIQIKDNLERTLQAGFTTVADKGFCNWDLKQAVEDGYIKGPRLLISCSQLSITGGHGDWIIRGDPTILPLKDTGLFSLCRLVDGVDDARKATREQLRAGADHIKAMATGGGATPNDQIWYMGFSEPELRAIVEEAESMGKYVAVHALNNAGVKRAAECGVRSIDHGTYMTEDTAKIIKDRGAFHVPTITVLYMLKKGGKEWGIQDYFEKKISDVPLLDESLKCAELAHRLGIKVGSGSDAFGQICGAEGLEIKLKTECGFTPYEAIKSATIVNADLFMMKDKIGSIEVGKWADIIVVDGKPDEDASLLCDPNNVKLVMKKGEIFKNTL